MPEHPLAPAGDDLDAEDWVEWNTPCPVCGSIGPCAYLPDGTALVHTLGAPS